MIIIVSTLSFSCNGHSDRAGEYHYHQIPVCIYNGTADEFLGVALDGFAIYGPNVSDLGRNIRQSDLDNCNGRTSTINGVTAYRYYFTTEYPYIMGCFKGYVAEGQNMLGYRTSVPCPSTTVGKPQHFVSREKMQSQ